MLIKFRFLISLCIFAYVRSAFADQVDDYLKTAMARQHIAGLSLAVIQHGKIVKCRGYGMASLELRVPASPETVYELASLTKSFVSNVVFLLKQDNKLSLEDKLGSYIDDVPERWKAITIRQLLSHTSGIPDYLNVDDVRHEFNHDATPEDIINVVKAVPLKIVPGAKWTYSNTDYVLLGMIIKKVSGETYDEFLAHRVFSPLHMTATRRDTPDDVVPNRASGYLWYGFGGLHNADFLRYRDGGILSTVKDLAKWDAALSTDTLLTASTKREMWSPITLNDGSSYSHGLGWFIDRVNGHLHISHAGGDPESATMLARYPDDGLTVIVLANGGAANVFALDNGVAQCYVPSLGPQGVVSVDQRILDSYTGYCNVWGGNVFQVRRDGEALVVDDGGRLTGTFEPVSQTKFVAADCDRGMTFASDSRGVLKSVSLRLGDWTTEAQIIGPLASSVKPKPDPDVDRTQRILKVLRAFERGGEPVESVEGVAPQARKDFARGPAPEFSGTQSISYLTEFDVSGRKIERHGAEVSHVLYYRLKLTSGPRYVLVYLTKDEFITDQDVVER